MKTVYYLDDGAKAAARSVRTLADGRQVELFAVRRYGKLYWTADFGVNYASSKTDAIQAASRLNLVRK